MAEDDKTQKVVERDSSKKSELDNEDNKPKTYTEKEYKELQSESVTRRKEIEKLEAKLKAIEDEKLSDIEKKDKRVKELEAEIENLKNSDKATKVDALIVEAISDKNIIDKSTMKLLIKNELASEEEINDKIVEKVVDKLIKDKPYLISSTPVNPSDGNFAKQDNEPAKTPDKMFGEFLRG